MLIGVVSDTHNNFKNIDLIINLFNREKISLIIHTGDIASAKALDKFSRLNGDLLGVFGNNDRNELNIQEIAKKHAFKFHEPPNLFTLCDRNIAVFHEPDNIDDFLIKNPETHLVLHGHTHRYREERINNVLFFNPGESAGMLTGKNAIGIVDLISLKVKRIFF